MQWQQYIISDKEILSGKPTIKDTRLSVDHIFLLAQGWTEQKILENNPRLTTDSFKTVFAYIYDCIQDNFLYPTTSIVV
jgi:uncharacterized protein (DUF433 family)